MFEKVLSLIEQYDTVILHRHSKPDGDALGSQIGLKHLIEDNFAGKRVFGKCMLTAIDGRVVYHNLD